MPNGGENIADWSCQLSPARVNEGTRSRLLGVSNTESELLIFLPHPPI